MEESRFVDRGINKIKFLIEMTMNDSYQIEEWWTDLQIELVKDSSRNWYKNRFRRTTGFWILRQDGSKLLSKISIDEELPKDAIIDNTAWDHEHCELCFDKISESVGNQQEGYTDGNSWLCIDCYNKYLLPRKNKG